MNNSVLWLLTEKSTSIINPPNLLRFLEELNLVYVASTVTFTVSFFLVFNYIEGWRWLNFIFPWYFVWANILEILILRIEVATCSTCLYLGQQYLLAFLQIELIFISEIFGSQMSSCTTGEFIIVIYAVLCKIATIIESLMSFSRGF